MEYNALIREYSGQSLKVLSRILVADLKDFPDTWKIRYNCKEIDRETTDIKNLCCSSTNPLQIYKPVEQSFLITVRTLDGKSLTVTASPKDTVKVLKLKIFQLEESFPPKTQSLHINRNGKDLLLFLDSMTLALFKISSGTTLFLQQKSPKADHVGAKFRPIDFEQTYSRSNGSFQSSSWAQYAAGFNFSGVCSNPNCVSKENGVEGDVVVRKGQYRELQMNFKQQPNQLICLACSTGELSRKSENVLVDVEGPANFSINPKCFILHNARSLIYYKRDGKDDVRRIFYQHKTGGKKPKYCLIQNKVDLDLLEINTVEPWRSPFCCVRCDTRIMFKAHEVQMECGHAYHTWCVPSILKGFKCTICSAKMLIVCKADDVLRVV